MPMPSAQDLPRLAVFGWHALQGRPGHSLPSLLDIPGRILTTSGRAAIVQALELMHAGPGDRILVPTYHCPTMIAPVTACGAEPVFYPITETGCADLDWLAKLDTRGVKALLSAHYFGIPRPFSRLRQFCDERGILLIEDCAHALFGISEGRGVGQWGDIAIASLTKFLPVQEGGVLASQRFARNMKGGLRPGLGREARMLLDTIELGARHRRWGLLNAPLSALFALKQRLRGQAGQAQPISIEAIDAPPADTEWLDPQQIGAAPSTSSTWVALRSVRERVIAQRRINFERLAVLLADIPGTRPLLRELPADCAPYVFPFLTEHADARYRALRQTGLPLFRWNWLWADTPRLAGDTGVQWADQLLQLPCHQDLNEADLQCIANTVRQVCAAHPVPAAKAA